MRTRRANQTTSNKTRSASRFGLFLWSSSCLLILFLSLGQTPSVGRDLSLLLQLQEKTLLLMQATQNHSNHNNLRLWQQDHKNTTNNNWTQTWLVDNLQGEPARILFIHVGKTGGVSLKKTIPLDIEAKRKRLNCLRARTRTETIHRSSSSRRRSPSPPLLEEIWAECYQPTVVVADERKTPPLLPPLARHVFAHKHLASAFYGRTDMEWILFQTNTFLITTRNPVARIVSSFNYHRREAAAGRRRRFFWMCFDNVDMLFDCLLQSRRRRKIQPKTNETELTVLNKCGDTLMMHENKTCLDWAKAVLQGKGPAQRGLHHFHHNYQYYMDVTMKRRPHVPVLVVRTEHLWDDAKRLDIALGGNGTFQFENDPKVKHYAHGSESFNITPPTTRGISSTVVERRQAICCEIIQEMEAYQRIILKAINLNTTEKRETLAASLKECGVLYHKDVVRYPFSWAQWYNQTCYDF